MSNILQQVIKNKKDPDQVKFEKLREEIGTKLKQTETDESALKFQVISLAEILEKIVRKYGNEKFIGKIHSMLNTYFKDNYDISEKSELMFLSFFDDYPQYKQEIVRNNSPYILSEKELANSFDIEESVRTTGSLPVENKLYRKHIDNSLSVINGIDFSKLTKDQCLTVSEKLSGIVKNKQHELEHNYRLTGKKSSTSTTTSSKHYDPYEDDSPTQTKDAHPGNSITQSLIKIRNQFNDMISQSQYMKFPSPELEKELAGYFETFYKVLRFITDKKHKASVADWSNMSLATNDFDSHYASSNITFLAPLCAKCKDRNEELDPIGKKKIFTHVQMYSEYQIDRKLDKDGKPTVPLYIWRCRRCKGTEQKEETMSVERINESIIYINTMLIDIMNKSDIYRAISIYFEELVKPQRLVTAHNTSNKLLSKK